jgi:hypothetical protein
LFGTAGRPIPWSSVEAQDVHKNAQQDVKHIPERSHYRNGGFAGLARVHPAGHLMKSKPLSLQHHEDLDLRIL